MFNTARIRPVVLRKCGACQEVIIGGSSPNGNECAIPKDLSDHFVILGLGHGYVFRKYLCPECYSKVCDCLGLDRDNPWIKNAEFMGEIEEDYYDEDLEDLEASEK